MAANNIGTLIAFVLYLSSMLLIGWIFYNRTKNLSDYILGGRTLNSWVTSMSAQASDMSGWLLMGLPGYAYIAGMESIWIAFGLILGTYLNWKFVARRLRKYTEISGNSITIPDYFENRFRDDTKVLRVVSALFILIFFLIYTASGFVAGAKLFSTVFNLSYLTALSIGACVIIAYTFLGGFMAVSWTDFFQGLIMFFAILTVPFVGIYSLGGINETFVSVKEINAELLNIFTKADGEKLSMTSIISLMGWGLGYFGQPHILARFMAIRHPNQIKQSRIIAMIWVTSTLFCAVLLGLVGNVYLKSPLGAAASETVFMVMVNDLAPPFFAGFLLAAILAAVMSTADSQLLVSSSALTEDFYRMLFRKKASDKELVWVSRFSVIGIAIIAFFIALDPESSVLELVAFAWGGFGAAFGPLIILSLAWRRMTLNGAVGGIIAGGVTVFIWERLQGGLFDVYEIIPGFVFSSIVIIALSLLDKAPAQEILDEFADVDSETGRNYTLPRSR